MSRSRWPALIGAEEAAAILGVTRASLYCYVSRGLIRSFRRPDDPRARLYSTADVELLHRRTIRMRRPLIAVSTALDWGLPVLESSITEIKNGLPFYRGRNALILAQHATLEDAACLLWQASSPEIFRNSRKHPSDAPAASHLSDPIERIISELTVHNPYGLGLSPRHAVQSFKAEAALLQRIAAIVLDSGAQGRSMHRRIASAWQIGSEMSELIRAALVICADHELTASSFAVRVVASTGAPIEKALIAGLAALGGPRHTGGEIAKVHSFLQSMAGSDRPWIHIARFAARDEPIPGFGHPLYPDGDPRAEILLSRLTLDKQAKELVKIVEAETGIHPTLSFALVAVERSARLPQHAAQVLLITGRSAGLIAHAIEQRKSPQVIRPRAKYVEI